MGAISKNDGTLVGELLRYEPFGDTRGTQPSSDITDRGFTGHRENRDIGLTYMNARYYVGEIGRFASADTLVPDPMNPQTLNRFAYVTNNPLNYVDPSGHCNKIAAKEGDSETLVRDTNDQACWDAYDSFASRFSNITLDDTLRYDGLQTYINGYGSVDEQNWLSEALLVLLNAGPSSRAGAEYIVSNNVTIRIREFSWWQQGMGIRWSSGGVIEMRADRVSWTDPVELSRLPGIAHEVKHLEQGTRIALSQLGEVQAWNIEYMVAQELNVNLSHIPTEVVDWGNNPTESNFRDASQAIVSSQPRTYFFWLLPQLPYRDYGQSFENLP